MSISRIGKESVENGSLVRISGQTAFIKRLSNSEEVQVSVSEFLQNNIQPEIGKVYRYNVFVGAKGRVRITNIRRLAYLYKPNKSSVHSFDSVFAERCFESNAVIDWFNWYKGYGAVMMWADESTAFLHMSLVKELLREYGFPHGANLKGQEVHVVVLPDPEKDLRVTRIEFV